MESVDCSPNIPHGEGLASLNRFLGTRDNKQISSDNLTELAQVVLKRRTEIGTKFAPPYAILAGF